jgi:hypothetical protein
MTNRKLTDPKLGDLVKLKLVPPGVLEDLPMADRKAILKASASPMRLIEYDEVGRAGLQFTDGNGIVHIIYVNPDLLTIVSVNPR